MTLHRDARQFLDVLAGSDAPPLTSITPAEAREGSAFFVDLIGPGPDVAAVRDIEIPGPNGVIPARLYEPTQNPVGTVVYYHGGGWVLGCLDEFDAVCQALAVASGARVVSVDYRLAPEHRFPAAVDDAFVALVGVAERHPGEPIVVAGDSAGGNLAAVSALRARDAGGPSSSSIRSGRRRSGSPAIQKGTRCATRPRYAEALREKSRVADYIRTQLCSGSNVMNSRSATRWPRRPCLASDDHAPRAPRSARLVRHRRRGRHQPRAADRGRRSGAAGPRAGAGRRPPDRRALDHGQPGRSRDVLARRARDGHDLARAGGDHPPRLQGLEPQRAREPRLAALLGRVPQRARAFRRLPGHGSQGPRRAGLRHRLGRPPGPLHGHERGPPRRAQAGHGASTGRTSSSAAWSRTTSATSGR